MFSDAKKGYIIVAVLLVVFSCVAFIAPFQRTAAFWVAYALGVFAILFQLYIIKLLASGGMRVKSRLFGFPIVRLGIYYLVGMLAASCIEMVYADGFPVWLALVFGAVMTAVTVAGCAGADAAGDGASRPEAGEAGMRELRETAAMMARLTQDDAAKAALGALADEFGRSAANSVEAARPTEARISSLMGEIQQALVDGKTEEVKRLCGRVSESLAERNRLCSADR